MKPKITVIIPIYNAEDTFSYDVKVFYMDDDYFKVDMINTLSNHEQVILRNNNDVYVVTPSLNKSYKFGRYHKFVIFVKIYLICR